MEDVFRKHRRSKPRSWASLIWAHAGFSTVVMISLCLVLAFGGARSWAEAERLNRDGLMTMAEVISREANTWEGGGHQYYVTFRYDAGQGPIEVTRPVSRTFYDAAGPGTLHETRYLHAQPRYFELAPGERGATVTIALAFSGAFGVAGLGLLFLSVWRSRNAVLARQFGVRQVVEVQKVVISGRGGLLPAKGHLVWETDDGKRHRSLRGSAKDLLAVGRHAKINVYTRGDLSVWQGDVGPHSTPESDVPKVRRQ